MNNEQPAIDVQSSTSAVALREEPQGGSMQMQRFDKRAADIAIESILNRAAVVGDVMAKVMREGVHYGTIPGTDNKKVLLKAGAEKLSAVFQLIPQFLVTQTDYANNHREYRITCRFNNGVEGLGTCTTLEEKYRYRKAGRKCPKCGKETIIEGKAEYGGGWLCWTKKGGCGEKFAIAEPAIAQQASGKVEHPNPADYWNTCLKMAKKRALVDATITATSTSDLLTQDVEEMQEMAEQASAAVDGKAEPEKKSESKKATPKKKDTAASNLPAGVKSDLSKEEFEKLWAFMEAGKAKFLLMANDEVTTPFAWTWAVRKGHILETEKLEAITPGKLFPSCSLNAMIPANQPFMKADYLQAVEEITAIGKAGPLPEIDRIAYEKAYGLLKKESKKAPAKEPEVPRDTEAEWKSIRIPTWSAHVKEKGFKTFGDLPKNLLWWWCIQWQPKPYNGQPIKQEDIDLRKILDFVKDNYDFESKDDAGSAPGSAEPAEPEDNVPF